MKFFDKIKDHFQKGTKEISEISGEWIKKGQKLGEESLNTAQKLLSQIEAKTNEASAIVKLKMDISKIKKQIEQEKQELGKLTFELSQTPGKKITKSALSEQLDKIGELEKLLEDKTKEYDLLRKVMSDSYVVDKLSDDLEKSGNTIDMFVVPEKSFITGKMLKEVTLPKDVLITTVKKGSKVLIPDGNTKLEPGDQITVIGKSEDVEKLVKSFQPDKPSA